MKFSKNNLHTSQVEGFVLKLQNKPTGENVLTYIRLNNIALCFIMLYYILIDATVPNTLDVGRGVVATLPVLSLQRYYGGRLTGTGSRQQETCGGLPVMTAATSVVMATRQRYVAGTAQRYHRAGIVVPRRPVFGITVVNSENA